MFTAGSGDVPPSRQLGSVIRVGTRGSLLARTQTEWVAARLRQAGHEVHVVIIATQGDTHAEKPIAAIGGDGVFVRELERALLDGRIDTAVHSLKDVPTEETPGLTVAAVPERAMPFDVLVARAPCTLESLPPGAVVGTSSVRRVAQIKSLRRDLVIRPLRGNVDTRLRRLETGDYDALVLAGAGLERLGLADRITHVLRPDAFWPAVSQGALGIQVRRDDPVSTAAVRALDHAPTHAAVRAERKCLAELAGGCLAPIGAWGHHDVAGHLRLGGCVLEDLGDHAVRIEAVVDRGSGAADDRGMPSEALGLELATRLRAQGADAMLERMRARSRPP